MNAFEEFVLNTHEGSEDSSVYAEEKLANLSFEELENLDKYLDNVDQEKVSHVVPVVPEAKEGYGPYPHNLTEKEADVLNKHAQVAHAARQMARADFEKMAMTPQEQLAAMGDPTTMEQLGMMGADAEINEALQRRRGRLAGGFLGGLGGAALGGMGGAALAGHPIGAVPGALVGGIAGGIPVAKYLGEQAARNARGLREGRQSLLTGEPTRTAEGAEGREWEESSQNPISSGISGGIGGGLLGVGLGGDIGYQVGGPTGSLIGAGLGGVGGAAGGALLRSRMAKGRAQGMKRQQLQHQIREQEKKDKGGEKTSSLNLRDAIFRSIG